MKKMALVDSRMIPSIRRPPTPPLVATISDLDRDMKLILDQPELNDSEKVRRYNGVLSRYKSYRDQYQRPIQHTSTDKSTNSDILETIPKKMRDKANYLLRKLTNFMEWNDKGEIIYNGQNHPGTNISDLVNDALRDRKKPYTIKGKDIFIKALKDANVPLEVLGNTDILTQLVASPIKVNSTSNKRTPRKRKPTTWISYK